MRGLPPWLKPKRRWFQFSIRGMLLLTAVVALWLGWKTHQVRQQETAIRVIQALGGDVSFDYQTTEGPPGTGSVATHPRAIPSAPRWARRLLGEEYFRKVAVVSLRNTKVTDADLRVLLNLPQLRLLVLDNTAVTDQGLEYVGRLRRLRGLTLCNTKITDAGMIHLQKLTELRYLSLWNDNVGDSGVENLAGLVKLQSLILDGTKVTDAGLASIAGLTDLEDWLGLTDTPITDEGLENLKNLKKLKTLNLRNTRVTPAGMRRLKAELPTVQF